MTEWMGFEIFINIFQSFLIVYFVWHRFHIVRTDIKYALLTGAAICAYLTLYLFFDMPVIDTFVFIIPLLYTFWAADDKWYMKVFWNIALALVFIGVVNLTINIFLMLTNASFEEIISETPLRVAYVISCNIMILLVVFLMTRLLKRRDTVSLIALIVFFIMVITEFIVIELLYVIRFHVRTDDLLFTAASICMLICATLSLLLFEIMSANTKKQQLYETELKTVKMTQQHYEEMKDMYSYLVSYQHDAKHQFDLVKRMVGGGHANAGKSFFQELSEPPMISCEFITGCIAVDALLTIKKLTMDKNHIDFIFQPYPLQDLPLCESVFCVLLANLIDNAIEANLRLNSENNERRISLKLARSWDMFFITCENTMLPSSIHRDGVRFISSKIDKTLHGFGTAHIKSIVNEASGQCNFIIKESVFRVEIIIPYSKENNDDSEAGNLYVCSSRETCDHFKQK